MAKYKIFRSYIVEAKDKGEALKLFNAADANNNAMEYLDFQGMPKEVDEEQGWKGGFKKQVTGK